MQCDRLEQEREDHQGEPADPDGAPQRMGQETEGQRGFGGGVFDPHALEDAGERVGYCSPEGADEDHVSPVRLDGRYV